MAQEVTSAEASSILLYNPAADVLEFALAKNEASGEETEQILKRKVELKMGEELLGVIEVLNSKGRSCFDREDEEILNSFGQLAGVAIIRSRLLETQLKQQKLQIANNLAHKLLIQLFLCQTIPFLGELLIMMVLPTSIGIGKVNSPLQ